MGVSSISSMGRAARGSSVGAGSVWVVSLVGSGVAGGVSRFTTSSCSSKNSNSARSLNAGTSSLTVSISLATSSEATMISTCSSVVVFMGCCVGVSGSDTSGSSVVSAIGS